MVTSHKQGQVFPGSRKKGKGSPRQVRSGDASQRLDPEMRLFRKLTLCLLTKQFLSQHHILSRNQQKISHLSP